MVKEPDNFIREEDFEHFEQLLQNYLNGQIDHTRFMSERLLLGVYGQRQEGLCMVRTKVPGGRLSPRQILGYAEGLAQFSNNEAVHITTRQDIQFHDVPLEQTPALLRLLASYGISSREAGGHTVRNVTGCPMAGVCPREHVDITTHLQHTAHNFVHNPLTQSLPRKFKIAFSGCEADCAEGMIHDLAVIATRQGEKTGFKLLAGGGLGSKPREAIVLEDFIEEEDLLPAVEAILTLHDKHSDRERRTRSRIKFLVERFGSEGFVEKFRQELKRTRSAFDAEKAPRGQWREAQEAEICGRGAPRKILPQHQPDLHVVPVSVPVGDLTVTQLRGLHHLLEQGGYSDIRTSQDQNLAIFHVPTAGLAALVAGLEDLGLGLPKAGSDVAACPGTTSCQLGITSSRAVAHLLDGGSEDLVVRVNGCQNNCARSDIADIGMYGKGRRHFGKLVPTYAIRLGGCGLAGGGLAFSGPEVPAARVPSAVRRIQEAYAGDHEPAESFAVWSRRKGAGYFDDLLADLTQVRESELSQLQRDHGDSRVFRVESTGVGECAGAQVDPLDKLLLDIAYERNLRDAFSAKRKYEDAVESQGNIFTLAVQALLAASGADNTKPGEGQLVAMLTEALPDDAVLVQELAELLGSIDSWRREPDELAYPELALRADVWIKKGRSLCRALQAQREKERKAAQHVA